MSETVLSDGGNVQKILEKIQTSPDYDSQKKTELMLAVIHRHAELS
jgi:hypothetical protein